MRSHRRLTPRRCLGVVAVLTMVLTACGSDTQDIEDASGAAADAVQQSAVTVGDGSNALSGSSVGPPSSAAPSQVGPPIADTVEVRYPDLVVETPVGATPGELLEVATHEGVDHFAGVSRVGSAFLVGDSSHPVTVLAVDPATFRPLTPEVTANVRAVWERLADGDVLVRHDIAHRIGLELGQRVTMTGAAGPIEVRVGAFASNGAPPLADVIVPWSLRDQLGAQDVNLLVVSLAEGADAEARADEIEALLDGANVTVRQRPEEREASLQGGPGIRRFESFSYVDLGDGLIVIDPAWVRRWIVTVDLPYLGRTQCHRMMVPQLVAALNQVGQEGLAGHFDRSQFAGCWVPRHIDWNPDRSLSMHAWGLAVDINAHDNALGAQPQMQPRIVEIFESWGFAWGGRWSRPDGMHFELARLIETG